MIQIHREEKEYCKNYRGISLIIISCKILFNVLSELTIEMLWDYWCGFRPDRLIFGLILTIRWIFDKNNEFNENTHQIFLEF